MPHPESTHPYGVDIKLVLGSNVELVMDRPDVTLQLPDDTTLRVTELHRNPREQAMNIQRIGVRLAAFRSAGAAEEAGRRLVLGVFWAAVSKRFTLGIERWVGDLPFGVYDRTKSPGISARAEGRVHSPISPDEFANLVASGISSGVEFNPSLLASLELYAAARLEVTERARFITLVTALEAVSVQKEYGEAIAALVGELVTTAENHDSLKGDSAPKESLISRVRELERESVRQAILRTVREHPGKDRDTLRFVDEAYRTRSKILHEGLRVADLHAMGNRVEEILRHLYASMFGLPLVSPIREP